mgnify:FL=1
MKRLPILALVVAAGCAGTAKEVEESRSLMTSDGHASFVLPAGWQGAGKGEATQEWQLLRGEAVVATLEVIFIADYADFFRRPDDLAYMVGKDDPTREYEVVAAGKTGTQGGPAVTVRYRMGHGATSVTGTNLFVLTPEGAVQFKLV